ncbi:hypothetical protein IGI04_037002 [Brassica rapa subsp. trilocularis]|uniref:DUF1664 domain-containing protein n=1 Tax=Brassica rapa subsp. trilocularis TaxID=1813537 RepID=A0ABQ7LG25_BRACM|nr:hypothetical protein IGI04_037002 [Brassica rapa subsp. trilocularis]
MAMQAGVGLSRILIIAGAGYTGTIMMKNGKLSDILGELQSLVKGMERSEGDYDDSDAVASQVRRLAMEVRQLASARQITVMDGVSGANLQALVVPAAVLGVLGYGYMWWKGLAFTDLMYVTKANMATAVANLTKNLEQVSVTLAAAKRHLTQKIQSMDDKVEKQIDLSKGVKNEVTLAREDINSLELDLASLNNLISGLDGKLDTLEYKQDVTNVCMLHLYNYFGGKSTKLPDMEQLQLQRPVNQKARNLLADVETKVGLKNFAEELLGSNGTEEGGATTVKVIGITKSNDKSRPLLSRYFLELGEFVYWDGGHVLLPICLMPMFTVQKKSFTVSGPSSSTEKLHSVDPRWSYLKKWSVTLPPSPQSSQSDPASPISTTSLLGTEDTMQQLMVSRGSELGEKLIAASIATVTSPKNQSQVIVQDPENALTVRQDDSSPIIKAASQEYPWAAKMKSVCNLNKVTVHVYLEDGTPKVTVPSHVLLQGIENQKEFVVGQFYYAPPGGLVHVVVTRIWGKKCPRETESTLVSLVDKEERDTTISLKVIVPHAPTLIVDATSDSVQKEIFPHTPTSIVDDTSDSVL